MGYGGYQQRDLSQVVAALGLTSIGYQRVRHAGGTQNVEAFLVNIALPNAVEFPALRVTQGELGAADVLIGMDIIGHGDFAVRHRDKNTKFSFRFPSLADIDFLAEDLRRDAQL